MSRLLLYMGADPLVLDDNDQYVSPLSVSCTV